MTQQATERSAEVFWARAIGGTVLGIIIGTFNRAIVADLLATRMFGQFLGFGQYRLADAGNSRSLVST